MKSVAILGNMNNLGFVWLRYIKELDYSVDLYLFENDCADGLSHFSPKNDTNNYHLYQRNIHQTNIKNGLVSVSLISELMFLALNAKFNPFTFFKKYKELKDFKKKIIKTDYVITMGIGPAFLSRFGRCVDLFSPYGLGVDNVETDLMNDSLRSSNFFRRTLAQYAQNKQIAALKKSRLNIISDLGLNASAMNKHDIPYNYDFLPLLYIEDGEELSKYAASNTFTFEHHGRHYWVNDEGYNDSSWRKRTKNTNLIIDAFKAFLDLNPNSNVKLKLVEYGKDVQSTKKLIEAYGLQDKVQWSGLLNKKELLKFIKTSTVGIGEFYSTPNTHWGCAGWEVLGMGKPLIQGGYFGEQNYDEYLSKGVLCANTAEEISNNMNKLYHNKISVKKMNINAYNYFKKYHNKDYFEKIINDL